MINKVYNQWKTNTYSKNPKMAGDWPERLDFIVSVFNNKVDTIVEFGTYEGCSLIGWFKCNPKKVFCVDLSKKLDVTLYNKIAKENNIKFSYIVGDDLKIEIPKCDLLFIDTAHTEEHTTKELNLHAKKVSKYIVFHDIIDGINTTQIAIQKFLTNNPNWITSYKDTEGCGLWIIEKQ